MNAERPQCCGAVLTGGQSSRMGSPKMFMELPDGRSMFEVVASALSAVCAKVVLAGAPPDSELSAVPYVSVPDLSPGSGPLAGIEALLSSDLASAYLVAACDQPLLTPELLKRLVRDGQNRARFFFDPVRAIIHTLPAYIPAESLPAVRHTMAAGRNSVMALASAVAPELVVLPPEAEWQLTNINTPEDYQELVHRLWSIHAATR